ncbi:MAG TPA: hypothetical protein PKK06_18310, partial [Phycisphaerae bacterium]|nr:hypothetical protein [Phycisphaerae bacterium]
APRSPATLSQVIQMAKHQTSATGADATPPTGCQECRSRSRPRTALRNTVYTQEVPPGAVTM